MHNIYGKDIIEVCKGKLLNGSQDIILDNFCIDTRTIKEGDIYIAIKGDKVDGHQFIKEAISKGAKSIIIDHIIDSIDYQNCNVFLVTDTIKCLQELAHYKRSLYNIPVIAITGSVGKTSTKDIIASVVSEKYKTCKTKGNYNNHLGVPLTILSLNPDDEALIVEMGMNHLKEISLLSKIAEPTIAVITNIGTAHIGNLGSRENILKAKLEILEGMTNNNVIINLDNDMLYSVKDKLSNNYNLYGISINTPSNYQATNIKEDIFSSKFLVNNTEISINVGGRAFIYNSLVAYTIGKILNIEENLIQEGIKNFKLSENRLEKKVTSTGVILIDDTYNANYDSMKASIELLGKITNKRKIAILGDMLELGEYSKSLHEQIAEVVINSKIDILITIGNESININKKVESLGMDTNNCYHFNKENECYNLLDSLLKEEDYVLIKGSHGIHLNNIVDYLMK